MGVVTIASSVPGAHATGLGNQDHQLYDGTRWWIFYFTSTNVLSCSYSSDYVTWTPGATKTLANNHNSEGRNFSVAFQNISGNLVVQCVLSYKLSSTSRKIYQLRGTISGTTLTWGTETQVGSTATFSDTGAAYDGPVTIITSDQHIHDVAGFILENSDFG